MNKKNFIGNRKNGNSNKRIENVILLLAILSSIFLFSVSLVSGVVNIDHIDVSSTINEGDDLTVSVFALTDTTNDITYKIYRDSVLVSTTQEYLEMTNYSSSGTYDFTIVVDDNESNATEHRSVSIIDVPLKILSISPSNQTYNNRTINVTANLNINANSCQYTTNNSLSGSLSGSGQSFYGVVTFASDGAYRININCSNAYESKVSSSLFYIDTTMPVITAKSYVINTDNTVTFSLTTDTVCNCKYDYSDKNFDLMSYTFSSTNNVQHHTTTGVLSDGTYNYYMRCKNTNDNVGNSDTLSFTISSMPKASISLNSNSPIKSGTYEVSLSSSENLIGAPSLYYDFNSDTSPRYVTLTGSGTSWHGYMIIDDNVPNMVGTFHYSGVDMSNTVGTIITSGQLFLVDTTKPVAPISLEAEAQSDGSIKVKWYYDGEDVGRYNIYRTTSGNPEYVDYIDSSASKQYIDEDTVDGITYYYVVAAVDDAGNDGILSTVVDATAHTRITSNNANSNSNGNSDDNSGSSSSSNEEFLDSSLIPKVEQLVTDLNNYINDIDVVKGEIDAINDPSKLKIINLLKLSQNIQGAKDGIAILIDDANALKNQQLTSAELDMKISKFRMDAIKLKSNVAEDIIVDEQSTFDQTTQVSDVDGAISELINVNLSKDVLDNYTSYNRKLQDGIVVNTDITIFKIKYLGKDDYEKYTLVKKIVSSNSPLDKISIIEIIPKSFERDAANMLFNFDDQEMPVIVKSDPVLKWDVDSFSKKTIYYLINSHAEMSSAKETKTVVLARPDFKVTDTTTEKSADNKNKLTGFFGLEFAKIEVSPIQWLIMLGVGMIIGLSAYYVSLERKNKGYTPPFNANTSSNNSGSNNSSTGLGSNKKSSLSIDSANILPYNPESNKLSINNLSSKISGAVSAVSDNILLIGKSKSLGNTHKNIDSKATSTVSSKPDLNIAKNLINNAHNTSHNRHSNDDDTNDYGQNNNHAVHANDSHMHNNHLHSNYANSTDVSHHDGHNHNSHSGHNDDNSSTHHTHDYMSRRLDAANILINAFDYEKSRQVFNECILYYKNHPFKDVHQKNDFKIMLDHLYIKLAAYRLVHSLRRNAKNHSKKNIDTVLHICKNLYASLDIVSEDHKDDERKFIEYLHSSCRHLSR